LENILENKDRVNEFRRKKKANKWN
jgi:hypothetical protein